MITYKQLSLPEYYLKNNIFKKFLTYLLIVYIIVIYIKTVFTLIKKVKEVISISLLGLYSGYYFPYTMGGILR